jgi:phage tail-like protein
MSGFFYLNDANAWSKFSLGGSVTIAPEDAALTLAPVGSGFVRWGAFVAGPFTIGDEPVAWFRLRADGPPLLDDEHVELFTQTTDSVPTPVVLGDPLPFADPRWHATPRDVLEVLIPGARQHAGDPLFPGAAMRQLWVGGILRSSGRSTPRINQIRVEYGRDTSIDALPSAYRRDASARERLERFLAMTETPWRQLGTTIGDLPRLFDPAATPSTGDPSWLSWLAAWLDFDLIDRWTEAEARRLLAGAFEVYGARGTVEGLRRYLKIYAGVEARIFEPATATRVWALGETSTLGFTTELAASSAEGAVLDATATLDASHLTRSEQFGAALFEDVAYRFCVSVYCADLRSPGALDGVRAVLDKEKPAHTTYSLRVIDARMRVGVQAQLGVDTIVATRPSSAVLGTMLGRATLGETQVDCSPARND